MRAKFLTSPSCAEGSHGCIVPPVWVGYVRISSVGGRGGESFRSPDDQRAAIEGFAKARKWGVEVLPPDLDESGGTDDRPQLQVAVEGIESGRWEGIIVYDLSRFFRNTRLAIEYTDRIERAGGRVVSTMEQLPPGSLGVYLHTILSAGHQHFRDQKSDQFRALQKSLVEAGKWRGIPPRGYSRGDDMRLVPNKDAPKIRQAFKLKASGKSNVFIQQKFGWSASFVRRMLRNPAYTGCVYLGELVNPAGHPPIVDLKTFLAVQKLHGMRSVGSGGGSLLAGLVRCEACGYVMSHALSPSPRYACNPNRGKVRCPAPAIVTAKRIEDYVSAVARQELAILDVRAKKRSGPSDADLERELSEAEAELAGYLSAVSIADVGELAFRAGARERRDRVERARGALASASVVTPLAGASGTAAEAWDRWTTHKRNLVLRGFLSCVVVRKSRTKVPIEDRTCIYPAGALVDFTPPLPFRDGHDELTLGVFTGED